MSTRSYTLFFISFIFLIACENGERTEYISADDLANPQFIGNSTCAECHEVAFENWKGSDHDKAMDHANDSSVLGDFNDATIIVRGIESRFYKKDDAFYVYTNGPEGEMGEFKIEYTFGHWPLQQYLIPFEKGRLQCLPIAWDSYKNKWFSLVDSVYADMEIPPDDWLYWTNNGQNWNGMCAECHSTNLDKGFDVATATFNTTWSEINVSCEACHGPASNHLKWAETDSAYRQDLAYAAFPEKSIDLTTEEMLNQCAFCHARRSSLGDFDHMGTHYLDQFMPQLVNEGMYYFDGQIEGEDYVFTSFTQSRMHTRHISCKDCHEPHNLRTKQQGNLLCLQCHNYQIYDTEEHHFHKKTGIGQSEQMTANGFYDQGDGTQCVDCHMTGNVYMGNDFRRDHNFRIPRPDVSMRTGSPDACTTCHEEMGQEEAVKVLKKWYPGSFEDEAYGDLFYRISNGDDRAVAELIPYLSDTSKSSMVRASAIEYISRTNNLDGRLAIEDELHNIDPLIRYSAVQHYWGTDVNRSIALMEEALKDSLKAIRIAALTNLNSYGYQGDDSLSKKQLDKVSQEYVAYLEHSADFAVSRHNLGVYYATKGDTKMAVKNLKEAILIDNQYFPAMVELGLLYAQIGNNDLAEKWLLKAFELNQSDTRTLRYLGLLKAEMKAYEQAAYYFNKLIDLEPLNARNYYNLAFIEQELNHPEEAEQNFIKACTIDPTNSGYLYALAYFYFQTNDLENASSIAQRMLEVNPQDQNAIQLLSTMARN